MRKANKQVQQEKNKKIDFVIQQDTPANEIKLDEKKADINIDEVLEESSLLKKKRNINLDDKSKDNKKKKVYDIDDTVIRDITLTGDIHVRLISNVNGYFVDIRKYFKQYPTKKGIRMLAPKFAIASEYLKNDLLSLIPKNE